MRDVGKLSQWRGRPHGFEFAIPPDGLVRHRGDPVRPVDLAGSSGLHHARSMRRDGSELLLPLAIGVLRPDPRGKHHQRAGPIGTDDWSASHLRLPVGSSPITGVHPGAQRRGCPIGTEPPDRVDPGSDDPSSDRSRADRRLAARSGPLADLSPALTPPDLTRRAHSDRSRTSGVGGSRPQTGGSRFESSWNRDNKLVPSFGSGGVRWLRVRRVLDGRRSGW